MANTYTYRLGNSLYINLTNRCTNACDFCLRNCSKGYGGYELWLDREPEAAEVIREIGDPATYEEIVFCGFGEPVLRLDALCEIARYVKSRGGKIRLNTNGQGNLIHGRSIVKDLKGLIDIVSISLNASNAQEYQNACHSEFGESAYYSLLVFARECSAASIEVVLSVVDIIGPEEVEKCKLIADSVGAKLRVRKFIDEQE